MNLLISFCQGEFAPFGAWDTAFSRWLGEPGSSITQNFFFWGSSFFLWAFFVDLWAGSLGLGGLLVILLDSGGFFLCFFLISSLCGVLSGFP